MPESEVKTKVSCSTIATDCDEINSYDDGHLIKTQIILYLHTVIAEESPFCSTLLLLAFSSFL